MKSNKIKNLKLRAFLVKNENSKKTFKFLTINIANTCILANNTHLLYSINNKKNKISKLLKNKCVLTGRNNSINRRYNISRVILRQLLSFGIIPGYTKSVW